MKRIMLTLTFVGAMVALISSGNARPVEVYQILDPIQDQWVIPGQVHELGFQPPFPLEQSILASSVTWQGHVPCPSEYQGLGAVQISMQNLTGKSWYDVWYVADPETQLSNWDEYVGEIGFAAWKSFKIDNLGVNTPLVSESLIPDNIFQPGEIWEFVIQEYNNALMAPPSAFDSIGIAGASAGFPPSSGSIIAWVPEPNSGVLLAIGCLVLLWRRRC